MIIVVHKVVANLGLSLLLFEVGAQLDAKFTDQLLGLFDCLRLLNHHQDRVSSLEFDVKNIKTVNFWNLIAEQSLKVWLVNLLLLECAYVEFGPEELLDYKDEIIVHDNRW